MLHVQVGVPCKVVETDEIAQLSAELYALYVSGITRLPVTDAGHSFTLAVVDAGTLRTDEDGKTLETFPPNGLEHASRKSEKIKTKRLITLGSVSAALRQGEWRLRPWYECLVFSSGKGPVFLNNR